MSKLSIDMGDRVRKADLAEMVFNLKVVMRKWIASVFVMQVLSFAAIVQWLR